MTLRVDEVRLRELRIGLIRPFRTSRAVTTERRICLLEFVAGGETIAWSECVAGELPDYTGETIDTAWHALAGWLLPAVLGRRFASPEKVDDALAFVRGHPMAKAAVEMGFQAISAVERGQSLAAWLGGVRDRVATGASLGIDDDADRLVERARGAAAAGYQRVKVKIEPGRDYEPLKRVRDALGPEVAIAADANGAYGPDRADQLLRLEELSLLLIEQPFAPDELQAHAALQARMRTPICLDESIESAADVETMLALKAGRAVNIKPGRVGGLGSSRRIHDLCAERGIPVFCGGMLETGVGRAYNRALAALPNFTIPGDLYPVSSYLETDIVAAATPLEGGTVDVPSGPGLGVAVDEERVGSLTVRSEVVRRD
jgi:O-succinylbenzoate synthase